MKHQAMQDLIVEDQQARQRALDISRSFLMQAPAGSGKTEVLTQRFLSLLAVVDQPEHILALTFTRKAASEMRYRVLQALHLAEFHPQPEQEPALSRWRLAKQVVERNRLLGWGILESPHRLRLLTIDSLCSSLVRQSPLAVQFASYGVAMDAGPLYQQAVQNLMSAEKGDWLESLQRILDYFNTDHEYFQNLLCSLLANREAWLADALVFHEGIHEGRFSQTAVLQLFEQHLQDLIQALMIPLGQHFSCMNLWPDLWNLCVFARSQLGASLRADLKPSDLTLAEWHVFAEVILKKDGDLRQRLDKNGGFPTSAKVEKKTMAELLQRLGEQPEWPVMQMLLHLLLKAPSAYQDDPQHQLAFDIFSLGLAAVEQLEQVFHQQQQVDFTAMAQAAYQSVADDPDPTELLLRFDYQIHHLLMDEFQDTSLSQIRLFERLISGWQDGEGKTLFFVGDPMQSIYGFRKADVNVFYDIKNNGLNQIAFEFLQLRRNFRSIPQLVNQLQPLLAPLFPRQEDSLLHQVTFSKAVPYAAEADNKHENELDAVTPIVGGLFESSAAEIQWMLQQIENNIQQGFKSAILVRKKNQVAAITQLLRQKNIAYTAVDLDPLWSFTAVKDLYHLAGVLFDVPQLYHFMAVCRGPFLGLKLQTLMQLAQEWRSNPGYKLPLRLKGLEGQKVIAFLRMLDVFQKATHLTLVERLRGLWQVMLGPELMVAEEGAPIEAFWSALDQVVDAGRLNLELLQSALQKANTSVTHPQAMVEIMTIHRSKGLEFPAVFVPFLDDFSGRGQANVVEILSFQLSGMHLPQTLFGVRGSSDEDQQPANKASVAGFLSALQSRRDLHELARLFYVAVTRAEHRLFLSATLVPNSKGEQNPKKGSILDHLYPGYLQQVSVEIPQRQFSEMKPARALDGEQMLDQVAASRWLQQRYHAKKLQGESQRGAYWPATVRQKQQSFLWRAKGEIIHLWLSKARQDWLQPQAEHWRNWTRQVIAQFRWQGRQELQLVNSVLESLTHLRQNQDVSWLLQPRDNVWRETSWQCRREQQLLTIRPDLVFQEGDDLWIVDFKTTQQEESVLNAEQLQKDYGEQLKLYGQVLKTEFQEAGRIRLAVGLLHQKGFELREI